MFELLLHHRVGVIVVLLPDFCARDQSPAKHFFFLIHCNHPLSLILLMTLLHKHLPDHDAVTVSGYCKKLESTKLSHQTYLEFVNIPVW